MTDELWRWSASDLARAIARGAISSEDATRSVLGRIESVNPRVNAVVDMMADEALQAAREADTARRSGAPCGPLHGVPTTVKVNVDTKGRATTNGVVAFRDLVATEDSPVVANLRNAGAVIVGRTNTPAFSHRWFTDNELHGPTRNPWGKGLTPGGSSGGAAAALAAGMGAIAHGNDYGGSIRYPAYACGVAGLRPTPGRVPAFNPSATAERPITAQLMSVQGPLARSIADLRLAFAAMARGDARDPNWVPAPLAGPAPTRPLRAAIAPAPFDDVVPEVRAAVEQAGRALEAAGYAVEQVAPPRLGEAAELWHRMVVNDERRGFVATVQALGDAAARRNVEGHLHYVPEVDAGGLLDAFGQRLALMRAWSLFFADYAVAIVPVSHVLPFPDGLDLQDQPVVDRMMAAQHCLLATPVLGYPSASVPTGLADGTPVGVQIISARFREDLCLDAAEIVEAHASHLTPIEPRD
ncbi:amidase family protein [Reyranella sp. MMS21-HV4-11]|uniref:Amidase family protein n=1 Tax=Reyranella humidisoli TaxID=2849149 RepID=A0ABS6IPT0_9HYPH|nr:amidase family protein [Reyranella sp. MMS21-HV4-11]MBU8876607.1 amidase family protein [Reyranella sp. MMS21-HV4-11]